MARDGEVTEHCPFLDRAMMAAGRRTLTASGESVGFGSLLALSLGTIHSGLTSELLSSGVDGGASGVRVAQEAPAGRVERAASCSPVHAIARDYAGVRVPDHIADALNRMARR